jgi:hypothetical protein
MKIKNDEAVFAEVTEKWHLYFTNYVTDLFNKNFIQN